MNKIKLSLFVLILIMLISTSLLFVSCNDDGDAVTITAKFYINDYLYSESTFKSGEQITKPDVKSYQGLIINYWTVDDYMVAFPYTAGTSDIVFKAYTTRAITVNFYVDNTIYKTGNYSAESVVQNPETPKKSGTQFLYWVSETGSRVNMPYSLSSNSSDTVNFYAFFGTSYTVNFYSDTEIFKSYSVLDGNIISTPLDTPIIKGKKFLYWEDDNGNCISTTNKITDDTNYYAVFEDELYNVNYYVKKDNSYIIYNTIYTSKYAVDLAYDDATIFFGWYTNSSLTTAYDFTTELTSNLSLYAKTMSSDYSVITTQLTSASSKNIDLDTSSYSYIFDNYSNKIPLTVSNNTVKTKYTFTCSNNYQVTITYDLFTGELKGYYGSSIESGYSEIVITLPQYNYSTIDFNSKTIITSKGANAGDLQSLCLIVAEKVYGYVNEKYTSFMNDLDTTITRIDAPTIEAEATISKSDSTITVNSGIKMNSVKILIDNQPVAYVTNVMNKNFANLTAGTQYTIIVSYDISQNGSVYRIYKEYLITL